MQITIRRADINDSELIARIGRETFYETWRDVNTGEDMAIYLDKSFDPEKIRNDISDNTTNIFFLATVDGADAGYAKLRNDRTYPEFGGESAIEIERIYVRGKFQKQKIGKALMDVCLQEAVKGKYEWIWLGVNVDNHKAIDFYKAYGFTIFGTKEFQLGNAVDPDYLMKRRLVSAEFSDEL